MRECRQRGRSCGRGGHEGVPVLGHLHTVSGTEQNVHGNATLSHNVRVRAIVCTLFSWPQPP